MPYVYCAFDHAGRLLYIGRATNWAARWQGHSAQRSALFQATVRLEVESFDTERETATREAELIATLDPIWNRQRPGPPDVSFRCVRCGCWYSDVQRVSAISHYRGRELVSVAGLCNDMSAQGGLPGGTPEAPCRGAVVPA